MSEKKFTPEEIVKSLRMCAKVGGGCVGCIYESSDFGDPCYLWLRELAADMIEEQAKRVKELEELVEDRTKDVIYYDEQLKAERQWIPVTERLPEASDLKKHDYRPVIVRYMYLGTAYVDSLAIHDGTCWRWFAADYGTVYDKSVVDLNHTHPLEAAVRGAGGGP